MGRPTVGINAWCCAALCALGASLAQTAAAQGAADLLSGLPRTSLLLPADAPLVRSVGIEPSNGVEPSSKPLSLSLRLAGPASGMPLLMQLPQDQVPGQITRPKYALGFQSETMRRWAKDFGMDAQTCFAPIVRARTRLSQDGGLSGSLMIHARCSFH